MPLPPVRTPARTLVAVAIAPFVAVLLAGALLATVLPEAAGRPASGSGAGQERAIPAPAAADRSAEVAEGERQAAVQCATCHTLPPPEILPRSSWRDEVARMYLLMTGQPEPAGPPGTAARTVPLPPAIQAIARYYEARAPERLPPPEPWPAPDRQVAMRRHALVPPGAPPTPAVAHVRLLDLDGDGRLELIASDMRYGFVMMATARPDQPEFTVVARLSNPTHVEPVDLDGDGQLDFVVGDLGTFLPEDHQKGSVVWLKGLGNREWDPFQLSGWPRVADVQPADFDGDGRLDLAVAAFGWRKTGDFSILRNKGTGFGPQAFEAVQVDQRHGAIHAPPVDLNGDGRPDLIVLFAQEHETVVAYINKGAGLAFEPQTIYTAPHPNWGSSGIEVVDLDGDGDLDVLLTHGDTFDDKVIKPYHGIQWLENTGSFPWKEHRLAYMPGVSRAQAGDLDGDGDLDVVACALLSADPPETADLPSLAWLEQVRPGVFEKRTLEKGQPYHATLDLGDVDADGDLDIVVGNFSFGEPLEGWVQLWENIGGRKPEVRGAGSKGSQ